MMMIKEKKDMKPFLVKFGVALALSFAGYFFSRIRIKRIKPPDSPPPTLHSECDKEVDYDGRSRIKDHPQPEIDSIGKSDKPCIRVQVDSSSKHDSPKGRYIGDRDGYLLPEFNQVVKEFDGGNLPMTEFGSFTISKDLPKSFRKVERDDYEQEIETLKKRIKFLVERERKLEIQLLEYYGLKEQETVIMELRNRLKIHSIEAKLFTMKIENLQKENKSSAEKVADFSKVVTELEASKAKIKMLKRKIRDDAEQNKEQVLDLTERVLKLKAHEHENENEIINGGCDVERVSELEVEVEELRKCNEDLKQENAELAQRLESTQILANSLFEVRGEGLDKIEELHQAMSQYREKNEKLKTEVERLQADRCADAEELVYLRWINACLRYELRNYQPTPGKTVARDLSKCLSPTSEKKAKQLILEYATNEEGNDTQSEPIIDIDFGQWPSSKTSYLTDSTDQEEFPGPRSSPKKHSKKLKFFSALRKLVRGKSIHNHNYNHNDSRNQSAPTSPMYRSFSVDDMGKKFNETRRFGSRSNPQSPNFASSSRNSSNSLVEYQRLSSLEEEENASKRAHSRSYSSPGGVFFVLGSENTGNSSPLHYTSEQLLGIGQKSNLVKYAEVLRDNSGVRKHTKKSASISC